MGVKSYLWPGSCPRCKKSLPVGTKLSVLWNTITGLRKLVSGKGGLDQRYTEATVCSFCGTKK